MRMGSGKGSWKQGVGLFFSFSEKQPVGRTFPGCCGIAETLPEFSGVVHRRTSPASFITLITVLWSEDNISKAKGQFLQPRLTWPAGLYFPLWLWVQELIRSRAGRCCGLWRRWFKVIVEMSAWLHELGSQKQQHVSYIPPLHGPDYRFLGSLPWENLGLFWSKSVVNTLLFESS